MKIRLKTFVKKTFDRMSSRCLKTYVNFDKKDFSQNCACFFSHKSFSNSQSFLRKDLDILFNFFLSAEMKRVVWKEFMVTYVLLREWEENLDIASQNPHNCWTPRLILKANFLSVDLRACLLVCWVLCQPACLSVCQSKFLSCPSFFLVTSFFWVISGFWN